MELTDLALGQGQDADAAEAELLVEGGDVLLVAREPVERLGDDHGEGAGAGVLEQLLVARSQPASAGGGGVVVGRGQGPALPVEPLPADPHLVLDRRLALKVRRIPGIDHSARGGVSNDVDQDPPFERDCRSTARVLWTRRAASIAWPRL